MIKNSLAIFFLLIVHNGFAQEDPLEEYIRIGLETNLALQQQEFSLEKSVEVLNEARGLYFPSIDIGARYTRAGGGRDITIPIGDLVNPIYRTLNQLLEAQGLPHRPFAPAPASLRKMHRRGQEPVAVPVREENGKPGIDHPHERVGRAEVDADDDTVVVFRHSAI